MKIVKTFNTLSSFAELLHIEIDQAYFSVSRGNNYGEIMTPLISPGLLVKYLGFEVIGTNQRSISCAAIDSLQNWIYFKDGQWHQGSLPVFHDPAIIREGLAKWYGPIQFRIRVPYGEQVTEIKIGYKISQDLLTHIMEFALPEYLQVPIQFAWTAFLENGLSLPAPPLISFSEVKNIFIQPIGSEPITGILVQDEYQSIRIQASYAIEPQIVQIIFEFIPIIEFVEILYQISSIPVVLLRRKDPINFHRPFWNDAVLGKEELAYDTLVYACDYPIEVTVIAHSHGDCKTIADALINKIYCQGVLHLEAFGFDVGLQFKGGITFAKDMGDTKGGRDILHSANFTIHILRVSENL